MKQANEIYNWVLVIIDSCTDTFHFDAVDKLIELFAEKFTDEEDLQIMLQQIRQKHWNTIHYILI